MKRFQVWLAPWSDGHGPIPERLPQTPIACGGPVASNVTHIYPVSVLPARYFEGGAAL